MPAAKILVADDDHGVRLLAVAALREAGFEVQEASDGQEALDLARQGECDLMVLDVVMPGLDGWQVLKELRSDERIAGLPVVLLTVLDEPREVLIGWNLGADYYLTKPFMAQDLVTVVERLLVIESERQQETPS